MCGIKSDFRKPFCVGLTTFALTNAFVGWRLSKYLPGARRDWAKEKLTSFEKEYLFNEHVTNANIAQVYKNRGAKRMSYHSLRHF